jgi:phenylpropionate dioxygenase-like ring-hydroxylating dioxygenase large terminal subunit
MISEKIKSLIQSQDPHEGMDQLFFTNSEIFHASYEAIFKKQWVFLTHHSYFDQDDVFTYNLNRGFIEIKKTDDNQLSISASDPDIQCHLRVYESLVFINLSSSPYSFEEFIKPLEPYIKMHGLNDGKIAFQKDYVFNASHLATIHNFYECYHCFGGEFTHKDYLSLHGAEYCNSYGAGVGSGIEAIELNKRIKSWTDETQDKGLFVGEFSEHDPKYFRIAERTPLPKGIASETMDGSYSCSTLMGDFKKLGPDSGYSAVGLSCFNSFVANNEFVILFLFSPISQKKTLVSQYWITHKNAEVDVDKMIFLWDKTSTEDSQLCEMNQRGIESRSYHPGKYANLETRLVQYQKFYLNHLQKYLNELV